jgi:hypothetical protein
VQHHACVMFAADNGIAVDNFGAKGSCAFAALQQN